ncbi:MAG: hypothetical protein UX81_C0020G0016 [Parcubacteria group bacterium GW2011_GWA2_47_12]|nr:MAG: hypothetical protein UX81_C0020G0016 [Parcubacteria group bacterium GW2011_GWA2_47_12]
MKSWKQWPYWLRGGVIGGGVALLTIIATPVFCSSPNIVCVFFEIPILPIYPLLALLFPFFDSFSLELHHSYFSFFSTVVMISWFIVGSILGALIGYIKKSPPKRAL